jgi:hypothetical protein
MKACEDRYEGQLRSNAYGATRYFVVDRTTDRVVVERNDAGKSLSFEEARDYAAGMNAILNQQRERHGRCVRRTR